MQDVEFTVENKKLWILQTRSGKRTSKSAVKIAVDMVKEKLITKNDAILRIDPNSLDTLLHPTLDEKSSIEVIAHGLPASPGAASGKVVFSSQEAERLNSMMQDTILVPDTFGRRVRGQALVQALKKAGLVALLGMPSSGTFTSSMVGPCSAASGASASRSKA